MSKYLILSFKNAGLFRKSKSTRDFVFESFGRISRTEVPEFVEPITSQHISNVLHVLFGKRPKPMNRIVHYEANDYLLKKANESYLRITSFKDANGNFVKDTIQMNKAIDECWSPVSYVNWERLRKHLGQDFDTLIQYLTESLKVNPLEFSFYQIKKMILDNNDKALEEKLIKFKRTVYNHIYKLKNGQSDDSGLDRDKKTTALLVYRGLDTIQYLDGEIIVPVSDDDIEIIRRNKGVSSILDGGLVLIRGLIPRNQLELTDDHILVGNISLEKQ